MWIKRSRGSRQPTLGIPLRGPRHCSVAWWDVADVALAGGGDRIASNDRRRAGGSPGDPDGCGAGAWPRSQQARRGSIPRIRGSSGRSSSPSWLLIGCARSSCTWSRTRASDRRDQAARGQQSDCCPQRIKAPPVRHAGGLCSVVYERRGSARERSTSGGCSGVLRQSQAS